MAMHTDLLVAMARKGGDLVKADAFTPENLPELHYPLERARDFAARATRRSGEAPPASLGAFGALLDTYEAFYRVADDARRSGRGTAARSALRAAERAVRAAAAVVHKALAAEGRV